MSSFAVQAQDLEAYGMCFTVTVTVTDEDAQGMSKSGLHPHDPIDTMAMVDTGADISAIDEELAAELELQPVGEQDVIDAGGHRTPRAKYAVKVIFPKEGVWEGTVVASDLSTFHGQYLIGRDMLASAILTYVGAADLFTLSF